VAPGSEPRAEVIRRALALAPPTSYPVTVGHHLEPVMRVPTLCIALLGFSVAAHAAPMPQAIEGWDIYPSAHDYPTLVERLDAAIAESPLNKLSAASATVGAKSIGQTIPGNMVVFAFAPPFAVRMLDASIAAGFEAPLRFYITENDDGTATLSYKEASFVFGPYPDGGEALKLLAAELDTIQDAIAAAAVGD
jgi:uncharacterized protein (DUF302 family)